MNFDHKAVRRALMVAKNIATSIDPGFANVTPPMPPEGVPLERAKGGPIKTVQGSEREQNLAEFMRGAHPELLEKNGNPKVLYHGTTKDFSTFEPGTWAGNIFGLGGIYLSSNPKVASDYAKNHGLSGRNVMPVHVNMKNPYVLKKNEITADIQELKQKGYDGVIDGETFVPFYPHQIKSAVGNVGTFDPSDPDITKAEGGAVDDDEIQPRNLNPMGLYSAAAEAARAIPQERGTPQQMLATMKGVKPDELNWSGAQSKFANQKTITRDDLAQHFENSLPPISEETSDRFRDYTVSGGDNYRALLLNIPPQAAQNAYGTDFNKYTRESHWDTPNVITHLRLKDRDYSERKRTPKPDTTTNISVNTPLVPSGVGMRTIEAWSSPTPGLVVTKSLEPDERGLFRVTHVGTGLNATGNKAFSFPQAMDAARRLGDLWDGWEKDADTVRAWAKENGKAARDTLSQAANPLGKKALHLEELQSDWAQEGREKGFVGPKDIQKAQQDFEGLKKEISNKYAKYYDDLLSAGNVDSSISYPFLSNHYDKVDEALNDFNKNTPYKMFNLPLEDDKYGLFLYHKFPEEPVDEDRLPPDVADRLMKARESHNIIQNFSEKIKDPEYRKQIIDRRVQALGPHSMALALGDPNLTARYLELAGAEKRLKQEKLQEAPFVTNTNQWTDLGLKRALTEAARGDYDKLIWTPGAEQAKRYNLSQYIDELRHMSVNDGEYALHGYKDGRKVFDQRIPEDQLSSYVGKDIAGQIQNATDNNYPKFGVIKGKNLAVGGQGMFEYYDRILPRRLLSLAQEHDPEAKIEPHKEARDQTKNFPSIRITPRMRKSILNRGFKAFARGGAVQKHLFEEQPAGAPVKMPVMNHDKVIRRALMAAKAGRK